MFSPVSGSLTAWMAVGCAAARRRGLSKPVEYAVTGGVHLGGVWPAQAVASVPIVHGVVPSTQRRATRARAGAFEQDEAAQLRIARLGGPAAGEVEIGRGVAGGEGGTGGVA